MQKLNIKISEENERDKNYEGRLNYMESIHHLATKIIFHTNQNISAQKKHCLD